MFKNCLVIAKPPDSKVAMNGWNCCKMHISSEYQTAAQTYEYVSATTDRSSLWIAHARGPHTSLSLIRHVASSP